ncbi:hypothetical protein L596_014387 [Steinernema carpocapsae]|uniref:Uncharacterized protein n=1 Tax=Steinernema carpocapsae TaxID=34508 RepID=A0A4U5NCQ1_STECR|nr:hypothetical protein L596_014387 [Steinernema carpocapsae]
MLFPSVTKTKNMPICHVINGFKLSRTLNSGGLRTLLFPFAPPRTAYRYRGRYKLQASSAQTCYTFQNVFPFDADVPNQIFRYSTRSFKTILTVFPKL